MIKTCANTFCLTWTKSIQRLSGLTLSSKNSFKNGKKLHLTITCTTIFSKNLSLEWFSHKNKRPYTKKTRKILTRWWENSKISGWNFIGMTQLNGTALWKSVWQEPLESEGFEGFCIFSYVTKLLYCFDRRFNDNELILYFYLNDP